MISGGLVGHTLRAEPRLGMGQSALRPEAADGAAHRPCQKQGSIMFLERSLL